MLKSFDQLVINKVPHMCSKELCSCSNCLIILLITYRALSCYRNQAFKDVLLIKRRCFSSIQFEKNCFSVASFCLLKIKQNSKAIGY